MVAAVWHHLQRPAIGLPELSSWRVSQLPVKPTASNWLHGIRADTHTGVAVGDRFRVRIGVGCRTWCRGHRAAIHVGERPDGVRLAERLLEARVPFDILCGTWPEVFIRRRVPNRRALGSPRAPPRGSDDSERDDGLSGSFSPKTAAGKRSSSIGVTRPRISRRRIRAAHRTDAISRPVDLDGVLQELEETRLEEDAQARRQQELSAGR